MDRTERLLKVARALLDDAHGRHHGYELAQRARVRSRHTYAILDRMVADDWLIDGWEIQIAGPLTQILIDWRLLAERPPRRYYELTDRGRRQLGALVFHADA